MRLSNADIMKLIPGFMRNDEAIQALAKAVNSLITEHGSRIDRMRLWDKIDELDHAELDELAWELNIDWYSSALELQRKRDTIKVSDQVHSKRGTKRAVEQLISAYFGPGYVREWFEYDANPFNFVVLTTNRHITDANFQEFIRIAKEAKSVRSHLEGVFYYEVFQHEVHAKNDIDGYIFEMTKCGTRYRPGTLGSTVEPGQVAASMGFAGYTFSLSKAGQLKSGTQPRTSTIGRQLSFGSNVSLALNGMTFGLTKSGQIKSGTSPRAGAIGKTVTIAATTVNADLSSNLFSLTKAGTKYRPGTLGKTMEAALTTSATSTGQTYTLIKCGTQKVHS